MKKCLIILAAVSKSSDSCIESEEHLVFDFQSSSVVRREDRVRRSCSCSQLSVQNSF